MNSQQSLDKAKEYLSDILSFFGVNVEVEGKLEEDVIELNVPTTDINSLLIGRGAETLRSMQLLVSTMLRTQNAEVSRVNIDIADYKKQRAEKIIKRYANSIETEHTAYFDLNSMRDMSSNLFEISLYLPFMLKLNQLFCLKKNEK